MPTENFFRDTICAVTTNKEATFNTMSSTLGDYTSIDCDPIAFLPEMEKLSNQGRAGLEWASTYCNNYWVPPQAAIVLPFDFGISQRFGMRAFNGTITTAQQGATVAYKHTAALQTRAQGTSMVGTTLVLKNNNLAIKYGGMATNTFELSQSGGNPIQTSIGLLGTGNFTETIGFTPAQAAPVCPATVTSAILLTDADGTRDLYTDGDILNWRFFINNNCDASSDRIRRGNDSTCGPTGGTAKYVSRVVRNYPRQLGAEILVNFNAQSGAVGYWEQMATNESITTLNLRLRGALIASSYYYQVDWIFPTGQWTATPVGNTNDVLTYQLTFSPKDDGSTGTCGATFAVTNITASNYN